MTDYDASTYGDHIEDVYDEWHGVPDDTDDTVTLLADFAGPGPVLELGIGTGRVAIPLAGRGFEVHGIDASQAMVKRLRAKPGGDGIPVTIGDFADVGVDGAFSLVFVVFNTLFALLSQGEQVRCFENVARRLGRGGRFVVDAFVPDVKRFDRNQRVAATEVVGGRVRLDVTSHDRLAQQLNSTHVVITEPGIRLYPVHGRYAYPSELDLMARLAGLELEHRWGGWQRQPFTAESPNHVSIYGRTG